MEINKHHKLKKKKKKKKKRLEKLGKLLDLIICFPIIFLIFYRRRIWKYINDHEQY